MRRVTKTRAAPDRVRADVEGLTEPLTGRTLGELGLVERIDEWRGRLRVRAFGLTDEASYLRELANDILDVTDPMADVDVGPVDDEQRHRVGQTLRRDHVRPGGMGCPTRIYAVASGKGGVGKSTVTANLAVAMAARGQRVGVLDADVWGYSQPTLLGVRQPPIALKGIMLPVPAHGVRLMSIGFFVSDDQPVVWRGPMLHKALEQFLDDVYWGPLDVLLVDLPPGTGDVTMSILEFLPDAAMIVVTTPQFAAESVAARVGRLARDARMPVAGVVENMAGGVFGSGGGAALARELGTPLLGSLPLDAAICAAGDEGVPFVLGVPEHPAAHTLRALVDGLPVARRSLAGRALPLFVESPM